MDRIKRLIRDWLGFSRTEVNGFLILLPLTAILIFSEPLYRMWLSNREPDFFAEEKKLDSLVALWPHEAKKDSIREPLRQQLFFEFDPNLASVRDLEKLGFGKKLSTRIANYRQKGGTFRIKSDLLKIYGVDSSLYEQLYIYIRLPETQTTTKNEIRTVSTADVKVPKTFDLNQADTTQLKTVYGIGSRLAARIFKFRESLGGFVSSTQLREVYGLDSLALQELTKISFIDEHFLPRKINLNTADEKILAAHPYIKKNIAKAIIAYRYQHGEFRDVSELQKIKLIKPEDEKRLVPYLTVKD